MKLLFLIPFIALISADGIFVADKTADGNGISAAQATAVLQAQSSGQEIIGGKKLGKRSYGLPPVSYVNTYTPVLPWYRSGGLSSYGLHDYGWYPNWPLLHGGWRSGGWYKGW